MLGQKLVTFFVGFLEELKTQQLLFEISLTFSDTYVFSKNSLKICLHTGPNINPESRDIVDITPDKERLREYITKNFPNVEPTPSIEESCIYTVSTSMKIITHVN